MDSLALLAAEGATADPPAMFNMYSWGVVLVYLIITTLIGHMMKGKQATIKDFFLGGRKLPWYAVSGSIVATELSAMTLVGVPAFLWADTGDMKYAILAIGAILSRVLVGIFFIPKFYEEEIYSPYDYIGNQLGKEANTITSSLFILGGIMGQGTRVFLTAVVLDVVTGWGIHESIWIVGAVAVLWTMMGGITTVIWTDVVLFVVFTFSAIITICLVIMAFPSIDGKSAIASIYELGAAENKFTMLAGVDETFNIKSNYTLFTAFLATIGGMAAYGTDQLMAQRCFCCKGPKEACKALIWSSVGQIIMLLCLLMGVALWAYYKKAAPAIVPFDVELAQINENPNRLLPVFIKYRVHWFFGGLMIAGIFAAAISSLDSILAALSQQTLAATHRKKGKHASQAGTEDILMSRVYIVFWAIVLCGMASLFAKMADSADLLIELALSVVGYIQGGILGAFLLAFIPSWRVKTRGLGVAALFSVLTIAAITRHETLGSISAVFPEAWAHIPVASIVIGSLLAAALAWVTVFHGKDGLRKAIMLLPFAAVILLLNLIPYPGEKVDGIVQWGHIAFGWPWYVPLGLCMMLAVAKTICEKQDPADHRAAEADRRALAGSE